MGGGAIGGIGGIGGIGPGIAVTMGIGPVGAAPSPPASALAISETFSPPSASVVVTVSDAALRALRLDGATLSVGLDTPARLLDDLAAAALLALLLRDRKQDEPGAQELAAAASAVRAYLTVQGLGGT